MQAGAVGFSDDRIPLQSTKVVRQALEEAKRLGTFIGLHEEDPELNGILGLNENIAKEHFHVCGATGVAEYSMAARDAMIAHATGAHPPYPTFPRKKVSRWWDCPRIEGLM